jgi:hypothetical protein
LAKSEKPAVFERLFNTRYDPITGTLTDSVVDREHIAQAIKDAKVTLSQGNPANFLKDFIRTETCNENWPASIAAKKYTARQVYGSTGEKLVFEFVPYESGQTVPFPDPFSTDGINSLHPIESVSLPSAARVMGREDEAWLIQACVHQRLIETHFALESPLVVEDIFHLQNSVKTTPEIDALFLLSYRVGDKRRKALVTFEAKRNELILPDQIKAQITKIGHDCAGNKDLSDIGFVIGMACKSLTRNNQRVICLFELEPVAVAIASKFHAEKRSRELIVTTAKRAAYFFKPEIRGI